MSKKDRKDRKWRSMAASDKEAVQAIAALAQAIVTVQNLPHCDDVVPHEAARHIREPMVVLLSHLIATDARGWRLLEDLARRSGTDKQQVQ